MCLKTTAKVQFKRKQLLQKNGKVILQPLVNSKPSLGFTCPLKSPDTGAGVSKHRKNYPSLLMPAKHRLAEVLDVMQSVIKVEN